MDLVIERSRWLTGKDPGFSYLLRKSDGKMCCLGFYGLACGIPREHLLETTSPAHASSHSWPSWPSWLLHYNSSNGLTGNRAPCAKLMTINDSKSLSDTQREASIAELFAKHGVNVAFTGEYPS